MNNYTAAEREAIRVAGSTQPPAPSTWREWVEVDEEGQDWTHFEIEGWILACAESPEMCGLPPESEEFTPIHHHFAITSKYLPQAIPSHFKISRTPLGGVQIANLPAYISQAGAHVRLLHCLSSPHLFQGLDWDLIKKAAGTPIQLKISGHLAKVGLGPGIDPEVVALTEFQSFHRPDRRCPTIFLYQAEAVGNTKFGLRDILHFRLPFTRRHFGISLSVWSYNRPANPIHHAPHQIIRECATVSRIKRA